MSETEAESSPERASREPGAVSGSAPKKKPGKGGGFRRGIRIAGGLLFVLIALGVAAFYAWLGYVSIDAGEEAIVLRLGKYDRTLTAGPHFYMVGVETLERERVTNRRMEFGYSTRLPETSPLESDETGAAPLEYDQDVAERRMLTGDENLVDVEFVLEYDITDLRTFRLSVEDAGSIIRDVARAAVREAVAERSVDEVLRSARAAVEADAKGRITRMLQSYTEPSEAGRSQSALGVTIVSLALQDVYPPEPVREAFRDVTSALQDKERLQAEAETYRAEVQPRARGEAQRLMAEAQGYRDAKILEAEGEASRFTALLAEYRKAPDVLRSRLYIETLEEVLPRVDKIIMQEGPGERVMPYLPLGRRRDREP